MLLDGQVLPVADRRDARRAVMRVIREDRWRFASMLLINAVAALAGLVSPWLLGRIIDAVETRATLATIDRLALVIGVFAVAQFLLVRLATLASSNFGERTQSRIRERFLDRVLRLPPAVVEQTAAGDLASRGTNDVTIVGNTLRDALPATAFATLQIAFLVVASLIVSPILGAAGLVGLAGILVSGRWYLRRSRPAYLAQGAAMSNYAEQLTVTASGARTVENFSLASVRTGIGEEAITANRTAQYRTLFLRTVLYPSVDVSCVIPIVIVLVTGFNLLQSNALSLGAVVTVSLYMQLISQPVSTVLLWIEQLQGATAAMARLEGIESLIDPRVAPPSASDAAADAGSLRMSAVRHAYVPGQEVIKGVDLELVAGERLAIVGPSGAGKTTLGRLLAGHDIPLAGQVTLGGVPLGRIPPERLRGYVQLVTQEQHVFAGTIRDNLTLASPDAGDDDLRDALRAVGAAWLDRAPDGLSAPVGPNGIALSDGQAQQLALARVLLADPHTIILDEATSLLDPWVAEATERALSRVLSGRTIVAIAHRMQTARDADRVAVMEHGLIREIGTHDELTGVGGLYARLWRTWVAAEDLERRSRD